MTPWKSFAQPKTQTVHGLQVRLKELGYPMDKMDGKIGGPTRGSRLGSMRRPGA